MRTLACLLPVLIFTGCVCAKKEGISSQTLVQSTKSWDGAKLPAYPRGQPEVTVVKIIIPPGTRLPMHKHPVINAAVLLKGELTVTTDEGKTIKLKSGDPLIEVVERWHYGTNEGRVPAEILVVYAGVRGEPITIKK